MNLEDVQWQWQSHKHGSLASIDTEGIFAELRRKQTAMEIALLRRDYVEVGVGLLMAAFCAFGAIHWEQRMWLVTSLCCLFVAMFLGVDRVIQRRRRPEYDAPLLLCLEGSLDAVRHQIWLLRNVMWWYLLPLAIGIVAFVASLQENQPARGVAENVGLIATIMACMLVFMGVYRANQRAVEQVLIPRWQELQKLKSSLEQDP